MGRFIELIGIFKKEFSKEEKETYRMLYGDNEEEWPDGDMYDEAPVAISIDDVIVFNEHADKDKTTIDIRGGSRFGIKIPYDEFKKLMSTYHEFF